MEADQIEALGRKIVAQLNVDPDIDILSRWLSHYLAEKLTAFEKASGADRATLGRECANLVLQVWEHRHALPDGRRPFEGFEILLAALRQLNPNAERYPYVRFLNEASKPELTSEESDLAKWIEVARLSDIGARALLSTALTAAAECATTDETVEWLEAAPKDRGPDIQILIDLIAPEEDRNGEDDKLRKRQISSLKARLNQIDDLVSCANDARDLLRTKISALKK